MRSDSKLTTLLNVLSQTLFSELSKIEQVLSDEHKTKALKDEENNNKWYKVLTAFKEFDTHMVDSAQDGINSLLTFVSRWLICICRLSHES